MLLTQETACMSLDHVFLIRAKEWQEFAKKFAKIKPGPSVHSHEIQYVYK